MTAHSIQSKSDIRRPSETDQAIDFSCALNPIEFILCGAIKGQGYVIAEKGASSFK